MKWPYYTIIVLVIIVIWQWIDYSNKSESLDYLNKRNDSLSTANVILNESLKASEYKLDTVTSIMLKSLSNTNPVKQKHEKIRTDIRSTPVDSLFNSIKERSASIQPD